MLSEVHVIKRGITPHRGRDWVGAREAEQMLGVSRAVCCRLAQTGKLPGKLIDKPGQRRHYQFRYADVKRLRDSGEALKAAPRPTRIRAAWLKHFGAIPEGFTVISRDRRHDNVAVTNLALVPQGKVAARLQARLRRRRGNRGRVNWTLEMRAILIRDFATRDTAEIATDFGCSTIAVRAQAMRMGLRKSAAYHSQMSRRGRAKPLGTERLMTHDKNKGAVFVKVSNSGKQSEQWRPKTHVIYEQHTGKKVPKGWHVIFRDGNKANWEPSNLEALPKCAAGAKALAHFNATPSPLQKVHRIKGKLQREIRRQSDGNLTLQNDPKPRGGGLPGRTMQRWTPEMVIALDTGYPTRPFVDLAQEIGVTVCALKAKAAKLGIRRELDAMLADINTRYIGEAHGST